MLGKMSAMILLSQKLLQKTFFSQKQLYLEFLFSRGQNVDLRSNLRARWRKSVKRAIEYAFWGAVVLLIPELCADL